MTGCGKFWDMSSWPAYRRHQRHTQAAQPLQALILDSWSDTNFAPPSAMICVCEETLAPDRKA